MLVENKNNSITRAKNNGLRTLLRAEENSRALIKYVGKLSSMQLFADQMAVQELTNALNHLRLKYNRVVNTSKDEKELKYLETKGNEMKEQLSQLNIRPTLHELAESDENELIQDLTLLILDLDESFNIGEGLTPAQIEHLGTTIIQRMGTFTLEDIALCFYRAKCGDYGTVYNRLDLNVVNGWLNTYKSERSERLKIHHQSAHLGSKSGMSYDPRDQESISRVKVDRGDDTNKFNLFKSELETKKEARKARIERKIEKSKR